MYGSGKMYKKSVCLEINLSFLLFYIGISGRVCYDDAIRVAQTEGTVRRFVVRE